MCGYRLFVLRSNQQSERRVGGSFVFEMHSLKTIHQMHRVCYVSSAFERCVVSWSDRRRAMVDCLLRGRGARQSMLVLWNNHATVVSRTPSSSRIAHFRGVF